jgi:alkylresorcinol/alkylpyrone synthase
MVGSRHLALPLDAYAGLDTWGKANDAWIRVAQEVGEAAVRTALDAVLADGHIHGAPQVIRIEKDD